MGWHYRQLTTEYLCPFVGFFFLIQKSLLIITNKVQGTRQAYIRNAKTLQKTTITECITECLSTNKRCLQKLSQIN